MKAVLGRFATRADAVAASGRPDVQFSAVANWRRRQRAALEKHMAHALRSGLYASSGRAYARWREDLRATEAGWQFTTLPFTCKDDLLDARRAAYACPRQDVREWVTTSGTTGAPLAVPLTAADLQRLADNEMRAFQLAGMQRGDTLLSAVAMDRQFVAGLAYWLGAQKLGVACVRAGPQCCASWEALLALMATSRPRWLVGVPSLLLPLCRTPRRQRLPVRLGGVICIGESVRAEDLQPAALGRLIQKTFHAPVLSTYASTETCTTFAEGPMCRGGHLNPLLGMVEIIDEHGAPARPGQPGEVVVTPLGMQAMPLVRFRTGDIAALFTEPCACGRTTPRLGPILARRQQLLKVMGVSLYPAAVLHVLDALPVVVEHFSVATSDALGCDALTLYVQLSRDTHAARRQVELKLRSALRLLPEIIYCDAATLHDKRRDQANRKPARFIDARRP